MVESEGTPSSSLEQSGLIDSENAYEPLTDGAPERGAFRLVGGYIDDDGKVHRDVELRAMSGTEEDMLGNRKVSVVMRMNSIMASCITRLGDISADDGQAAIQKAVRGMPSGTRTHLLICLRIVSHYLSEKDRFDMEATCPACKHRGEYNVSLMELERYEWEGAPAMEHQLHLAYSDVDVRWKVITGEQDVILSTIAREAESAMLSYAIMIRMSEWDGHDVRLTADDLLSGNGKKLKLSRRARELFAKVRALPTGDRDALRADFLRNEPNIETDIIIDCDECGYEFEGGLQVDQPSFFFPQATSMRSKRKHTT